MGELFPGWDKAVASAQKVLGDKGKIPAPKPAIQKAGEAEAKSWDEFDKSRGDLEDQILALVDSTQALVDALEQFRDAMSDEDFGLNEKSDAKQIAGAKKLLMTPLDAVIAKVKANAKNERELNKHLAHIKTYKQGKI